MPTTQAQSAWPLQKPQQLVYIELGADNGGMMLGICEQGLSYRAMAPLKADGPVNFTFALDGKTRLQGTGEIVWSEEGGKTGALKFTIVSPQFRESLREWLASEATPKAVGREVTPAVALPLDSLSVPKEEVPSTFIEEAVPKAIEEARPTAPPQIPKPKPVSPAHVAPIAVKPVVPVSVEPKPVAREHVEEKPLESKPVEWVQPEEEVREVEAHVPPPPPPPKIEPEQIEAKLEPAKTVEPPRIEPIVPEPELRTIAPLPQAEAPSESVFSLPNFRLPSAPAPDLPSVPEIPPVPHLPMEEIVQSAAKTLPAEPSPAMALPPPRDSLAERLHDLREAVLHETESPVLLHGHAPHEIFSEDFAEESPRLNRAAAAGIISLALAVILAALVLSFRREVGEMLIRAGETLSGGETKQAPAQQAVSSAVPAQNPQPSVVQPSRNDEQSAAQPSATQSPKTADQSSVQTQDTPSSSQQQSSTTPTQTAAADSYSPNVPASGSSSPNNVQRIQDLPPATDGGNGQKEFEQARNILKGNHRQRDLSLAVKLLWTGVRKGNVPAEVTLADLYARGDGVARSCEQARVLLAAAVQKGSPEARRRLTQLKQQGCS